MLTKKLAAFIFARGGSKGVKNKNIRVVGGRPLIAHAIACAREVSWIGQVIVSTDSGEIAEVARRFGADVLDRPPSLAADDTPEIEAWRHAMDAFPSIFDQGGQDVFLSLPATSPLRAPRDVEAAIQRFVHGDCDVVFGISPSRRSPYLNMATIGADGLIRIALAGSQAVRRQEVPDMYDITTSVYVSSPGYIRTCRRLVDGRVGFVEIPAERALDVDDEFDLHLADLLLRNPFQRHD